MEKKDLRCVMKDVLNNEPINLSTEQIFSILEQEFSRKSSTLDDPVKKMLPGLFKFYIKSWIGFKTCGRKRIPEDKLFKKFKKYLDHKVRKAIQEARNIVFDELCRPGPAQKTLAPTQTTNPTAPAALVPSESEGAASTSQANAQSQTAFGNVAGAPFSLNVDCSTQMMENLSFSSNNEENQTYSSLKVDKLTIKELINWPGTSIRFFTNELSFNRESFLEADRVLTLPCATKEVERKPFISNMSILDKNALREVIKLDIFESYIRQYLRMLQKIPEHLMPREKYNDIKVILESFFEDVKEIDIENSMATNTSISFHIGKFYYTHPKNATGSDSQVNFTPRVNLQCFEFNAKQNMREGETSDLSFRNIKILLRAIEECFYEPVQGNIPHLTFRCTRCTWSFDSKVALLAHLDHLHPAPLLMKCTKCEVLYEVPYLTLERWKHECIEW